MSEKIKPSTEDHIISSEKTVVCDGPAVSKHPRVVLAIDEKTKQVVCPYCGRVFEKA